MKNFNIIILCCLFYGCSTKNEYKIVAKWIASESNAIMCEDCEVTSRDCCVLEYNGKRYRRYESYVLNEMGKVDSIYSYAVPLGVNVWSIEEYISFNKLSNNDETLRLKIYWDGVEEKIIDGQKTISNFQVDKTNKYLVVKDNETELVLYEFK